MEIFLTWESSGILRVVETLKKAIALANVSILLESFEILKSLDDSLEGMRPDGRGCSELLAKLGQCLKRIRFRNKTHREKYREFLLMVDNKLDTHFVEDSLRLLKKAIGGLAFMKELSEVVFVKKNQNPEEREEGKEKKGNKKEEEPQRIPFKHLPKSFHEDYSVEVSTGELKGSLVKKTTAFDRDLGEWLSKVPLEYFTLCTLSLGNCQTSVTDAKIIQILAGPSLSNARISTGSSDVEGKISDTIIRLAQVLKLPYPLDPFDRTSKKKRETGFLSYIS